MKSSTLLTTFPFILFIKFINGQQNGLVASETYETINRVSQQQPSHTMTNNIQRFLTENGYTVPLPQNANQHQTFTQTIEKPPPSPQQIPPDLQPQPLKVQQHLQIQKPLQVQQIPLHVQAQPSLQSQPVQLQPQMNVQVPIQSQQLLQLQTKPAAQSQDILQLQTPVQQQQQQPQQQPHLQTQPRIISQPQLQQPLQLQQTLQMPQPLQSPLLQTPQPTPFQPLQESLPFKLQQHLQSQQLLSTQAAQQPLGLQHNSFQKPFSDSNNLVEKPIAQQGNSYQPNSQIHVKWQSTNPQYFPNVENPSNTLKLNIQPQHNADIRPIEIVPDVQKSIISNQDIPSIRYYHASQQPPPPSTLSTSVPVVVNGHSTEINPSYNIKPIEESYIGFVPQLNYIKSMTDNQPSIPDTTKPVHPSVSILTIPSLPSQNTNMQSYYYSQQLADSRQNSYNGQSFGLIYPQQSSIPVTLGQNKATAFVPTQTSVLSSIPIPTVQAPLLSSQYGYSSSYPLNAIIAPAYIKQKPKALNLKSLLPLIFNLLKEKIAKCTCQNGCPCDCNPSSNNDIEVSSGYSSQKRYGGLSGDEFSVLSTMPEVTNGIEWPRERKNCEEIEKDISEVSDESQEEENSDEEAEEDVTEED